jgi:hypothetical protein
MTPLSFVRLKNEFLSSPPLIPETLIAEKWRRASFLFIPRLESANIYFALGVLCYGVGKFKPNPELLNSFSN